MFLQLTKKQAFWSLIDPETQQLLVHLTFQNPGPAEIDYENLSDQLKLVIDNGIILGSIVKVGEEKATEPEEEPEVKASVLKGGQEDHRVEKQRLNVGQMLDQGVRGIRDQLRSGLYDAEYVSRAIETEKNTGNRVTVIKALEQKLNKIAGVTAIVESEEEDIEIHLT